MRRQRTTPADLPVRPGLDDRGEFGFVFRQEARNTTAATYFRAARAWFDSTHQHAISFDYVVGARVIFTLTQSR
jgi:hypothetical protein